MKKIKLIIAIAIVFIGILLALALFEKGIPSNADPSKNIDPLAKQKASLHELIIKNSYTMTDDPEAIGREWVKMWLDNTYSDYGVSDVKIEYKSGGVFSELSDSFELRAYKYSVQLSSQKPIQGAEKSSDGKDTLKVLAVVLLKSGNVTLSGFLGPEEFDEYDAGEKIYNTAANDPRYSSKLKPFPAANIPENFEEIDIRLITPNHYFYGLKQELPNGIIADIYDVPIANTERRIINVSLFDLSSKKNYKNLELGEYILLRSWIEGDKLVIRVQKPDSAFEKVFYIDSAGNMTSEEYPDGTKNGVYSPDKSKYAYMDNNNIYVADVKGSNEPKLMIKGNVTEDIEASISYYPFAWIDNSTLIYGSNGYEWSNGCGLIDVENGRNTYFEQAGRNASPYTLLNGKLYTLIGEAGAPFDPGVIDLKDPEYSFKKIFKNRDFIEKTYAEGYDFSPDGTKIALLKTSYDPYGKNVLYICSSEDGSILKSYEFVSGYNRLQNLDYLYDGRIAIYPGRYVYSPGYMYIVTPEL